MCLGRSVVYAPRMGKPTKRAARPKTAKKKKKTKRAARPKTAKKIRARRAKSEPVSVSFQIPDLVGAAAEHVVHMALIDPEGTALKIQKLATRISEVSTRIKANPEAAGVAVLKSAMSLLAQKLSQLEGK